MNHGNTSSLKLVFDCPSTPKDDATFALAENYWTQLRSPKTTVEPPTAPEDNVAAFTSVWTGFLEQKTLSYRELYGEGSNVCPITDELTDVIRNPLSLKPATDFAKSHKIRILVKLHSRPGNIVVTFDLKKSQIVFDMEISPFAGRTPTQQISKVLIELVRQDFVSEKLSLIIDWEDHSSSSISALDLTSLSAEKLFFDAQKRPLAPTTNIERFRLQQIVRLPLGSLGEAFTIFESEVEAFLHLTQLTSESLAGKMHAEELDQHTNPIESAKKRLLDALPVRQNAS